MQVAHRSLHNAMHKNIGIENLENSEITIFNSPSHKSTFQVFNYTAAYLNSAIKVEPNENEIKQEATHRIIDSKATDDEYSQTFIA